MVASYIYIGERIMYHEEYNTFIQLNLLRVYFVGGIEIQARGDHTDDCRNQSGGTGFGGGKEIFVTAPKPLIREAISFEPVPVQSTRQLHDGY